MPQDLHTHTKFSPDSETEPIENIKAAQKAGLSRIAITDHLDLDEYCKNKAVSEQNLALYSSEIQELKKSAPVETLFGIELGNANYDFALAEKLLQKYKFEFVLLSLHALKNERGFHILNITENNAYDCFSRYFSELYEIIIWAKKTVKIDSLAHLTYPLRYFPAYLSCIGKFSAETDDIFKEIISGKISLEINAAGLRDENYRQTDPPDILVQRYFSLGGRLITTGSDAHKADDVGKLSEPNGNCGQIDFM